MPRAPIAAGPSLSAAIARATALRTGPERHPPAAPGQTKSPVVGSRSPRRAAATARAVEFGRRAETAGRQVERVLPAAPALCAWLRAIAAERALMERLR